MYYFDNDIEKGNELYELLKVLFPINRSLTGDGVRKSLKILSNVYPMEIHEVPTGTKVMDWEIPKEWNVKEAYIKNSKGEIIVDYANNNLHLLGYSIPIDKEFELNDLKKHLYSIPEMPEAIPYITSYYKERWGFCITENQKKSLCEEKYHVFIDSELKNGSLTYGEIVIPGKCEQEVMISTYICHPSMANNELSGPVVAINLAKWISQIESRYTYRFVFIPETIGSITYLSKNLEHLKRNVIAGFNITCCGDDSEFSYLKSRYGDTLADKVAISVLNNSVSKYNTYSYLERGSDERQYCSPGVDLPFISIMRSKYAEYPEYHTSLDNLDFVSPKGLYGSYYIYQECIKALEMNKVYKVNCLCEPQLGKRGLYPNISTKDSVNIVRSMMNFIAYADGTNDLIDISNIIGVNVTELSETIENLKKENILLEI